MSENRRYSPTTTIESFFRPLTIVYATSAAINIDNSKRMSEIIGTGLEFGVNS